MKKTKQFRLHQRQRISGKTVLIIFSISLSCLAVCCTILFNMVHPDQLKATNNQTDQNIRIVQEQSWINDKEISQPYSKQQEATSPNTLLAKKSKAMTPSTSTAH